MILHRPHPLVLTVLALVGLSIPSIGAARDAVCLYQDRDFSGRHICVDFDVPALRKFDLNDKVSSVKLIGNVRARFYEHGDYRGRSVLIERNVDRLGPNLNDQFSSLRVVPGNRVRSYLDWDEEVPGRRGPTVVDEPAAESEFRRQRYRMHRETPRVCLYDHWDYRGEEWCFSTDHGNFAVLGIDNRVSSLRLYGGARALLFEHPDFSGYSRHFTQDEPRFHRRDNDAFSAIVVRGR